MADLKESAADGLQVNRAAVHPKDVIRKQEHDTDMGSRPTAATVADAIANIRHDAVTALDTNSIDLTLTGQQLKADLRISADVIVQAASGPGAQSQEDFGPDVAFAGATITLASKDVTIVSAIALNESSFPVAVGVEGVDYILVARDGTLYLTAETGLVPPDGGVLSITYTYGEVRVGSALIADSTGVSVNLGTAHSQAAFGDHAHVNDHFAATGTDTDTADITIDSGQNIQVAVRLDPSGSLESNSSGVRVKDNTFASKNHTHNLVTGSTPGFMSSADKNRLDTLWNEETQTFVNTSSVHWTITGSTAKANVQAGVGLKDVGNGIEVDFSQVQPAGVISGYAMILTGAVLGSTVGSTSYFVGADNGQTPSSTIHLHDILIPKTGTITRAFMKARVGGVGSGEYVASYIRLNDTTNTIFGVTGYDVNPAEIDNRALGIAVNQGDRIALLNVTPNWVTKPTSVQWWCQLWIQ